ncbi:MAG: hypothetical protein ACPLW7_05485 [Minisyncoccia bacterium]
MQGILEILKQVPNIINNAFGGIGGIIITIFAIQGAISTVKFVINQVKKYIGSEEENEEMEGFEDLDDDEIIEIGELEDGSFIGIDDTEDLWDHYKELEEMPY